MQMGHSNVEQDNRGGDSQIPTLGRLIALLGSGRCLGGLTCHVKLPYIPTPDTALFLLFKHLVSMPTPSLSQTKGINSSIPHRTHSKRRGEALLHLHHLLSPHLLDRTMLF